MKKKELQNKKNCSMLFEREEMTWYSDKTVRLGISSLYSPSDIHLPEPLLLIIKRYSEIDREKRERATAIALHICNGPSLTRDECDWLEKEIYRPEGKLYDCRRNFRSKHVEEDGSKSVRAWRGGAPQ
jgi:hypothetical protein